MFNTKFDLNNNIIGIQFNKKLDYIRKNHKFDAVNHNELADIYNTNNYKCCSVIIYHEDLKEKLYEDSKHVHIENDIICSVVEEEARKRMGNSEYYSSEEIGQIFDKFNFPTIKNNYEKDNENNRYKFKSDLTDAIYQSQHYAYYSEIIEQYKQQCEFKIDEDGFLIFDENEDPIPVDKETFEKQWKREQIRILMPRISTTYERQTLMPEPFDDWDYRNRWQQWFFISKEHSIEHVKGGGGSSNQRENQGRYSHIFATLEKEYNYKIPTYIMKYDSENQMQYVEKSDNLKVMNHHLSGNYFSNCDIIKKLFSKDMFLNILDMH